ncbi:linoleate 13S-lipoxygenase 2-1, chloroplastic-like protein, partial [Tanacetum coccineum]
MLKPQVLHRYHSNSSRPLLTPRHQTTFVTGHDCPYRGNSGVLHFLNTTLSLPIKRRTSFHATRSHRHIKAIAADQSSNVTRTTKVKAVIAVQVTMGGLISSIGLTKGMDDFMDLLGKSILLELVAAEVDH